MFSVKVELLVKIDSKNLNILRAKKRGVLKIFAEILYMSCAQQNTSSIILQLKEDGKNPVGRKCLRPMLVPICHSNMSKVLTICLYPTLNNLQKINNKIIIYRHIYV